MLTVAFALALAKRNPMLHGFGLVGIDGKRLAKRVFGCGIAVDALQHPADLVERHGLVGDGIGRHGRQVFNHRPPACDRRIAAPCRFELVPEVDIGRIEIRLDADRLAQCVDRACRVLDFRQRDRVIEAHRMKQRMIRVEGDPCLVEVNRPLGLSQRLDLLGTVEKLGDLHLRQGSAADGVLDEGGGEGRGGGSVEHRILIHE